VFNCSFVIVFVTVSAKEKHVTFDPKCETQCQVRPSTLCKIWAKSVR